MEKLMKIPDKNERFKKAMYILVGDSVKDEIKMNEERIKQENSLFFHAIYEAINFLPEGEKMRMFNAVLVYALEGKEPDFSDSEKALFSLIKNIIDSYKEGGIK